MCGSETTSWPRQACQSDRQIPVALTSITTPARGHSGLGTLSTRSREPTTSKTTARIRSFYSEQQSTGFSIPGIDITASGPECIRDHAADLNELTVEGSTSRQTIGPYPLQRIARRASRPGTTGPDGNIVPEEFGQLRSISVAADPEGSQTHRRRRRTRPRCDSRPASGWYHLDVPRRSGDPG